MAFSNDILAGNTLQRPAIRSPNYVPGVSGWTINRDGSSEFASGTFRGPIVVTQPGSGIVLATIGANGNGSFQYVYASRDIIIGTLSVGAILGAAPRGTVAAFNTTSTLPSIPGGNVFANICWTQFQIDPTRLYRISVKGGVVLNTNSAAAETFTFNVNVNQPGGFSGTIATFRYLITAGQYQLIDFDIPVSFTASGPATVTIQATNNSGSTSYSWTPSPTFWLYVDDVGANTYSVGGTGSPPGSIQKSVSYVATASDTYDGNQGLRENDPNNLYTGQLSGRNNGTHENGLWLFNGSQMRTDLAGATIQSAKLWMYCTGSSRAQGSAYISYVSNSSLPSSEPSTGSNGGNQTNIWPVPGWGSVDITSIIGPTILSGGANGVLLQDSGIAGSASFYGAGSSYPPYLAVTYTK